MTSGAGWQSDEMGQLKKYNAKRLFGCGFWGGSAIPDLKTALMKGGVIVFAWGHLHW